jgi:hypothetical protein
MPSLIKKTSSDGFFSGIACICSKSGAALGTGFLIDRDDLIITCAHVIQNQDDEILVLFWGDQVAIPAIVDKKNFGFLRDKDIAVIRLLGNPPNYAKRLSFGLYDDNEEKDLFTVGFPFSDNSQGMFAKCEIIGVDTHRGYSVFQIRSTETTLGFSGAPLINRQSGNVVAVILSIAREDAYGKLAETAFAISAHDIYTELLRNTALIKQGVLLNTDSFQRIKPFELTSTDFDRFTGSKSRLPYNLEDAIDNVKSDSGPATFEFLRNILSNPRLVSVFNYNKIICCDFSNELFAVAIREVTDVFNIRTMKIILSAKNLNQPISVTFSKDGSFLAIVYVDNTISICRINDSTLTDQLKIDKKIDHLLFNKTASATIMSVSTWTRTSLYKLTNDTEELLSISHKRLSKVLLRDSFMVGLDLSERNIYVWDTLNGRLITTIAVEYPVTNLQLVDGRQLTLSGLVNNEVRWWNIKSGLLERTLLVDEKLSISVMNATSEKLISNIYGNTIALFDLRNGGEILAKEFPSVVKTLDVEADFDEIIVSLADKRYYWDLRRDICLEISSRNTAIKTAFYSKNLIVLVLKNQVEIWDTRVFLSILSMSSKGLKNISVSKGLNSFIAASQMTSIVISTVSPVIYRNIDFPSARNIELNSKESLLVANNSSEISVWDLKSLRQIWKIYDQDSKILKFLGDDLLLRINSSNSYLEILDVNSRRVMTSLELKKKVEVVACNREGTLFCLYYVDGELCVYKANDCTKIFQMYDKSIVSLIFINQSSCLVVGSNSIRIIDTLTSKTKIIKHTQETILGADFSAWSGTICINWGNSVSIYNFDGKPIVQINSEDPIQRVGLLNNGKWVMVIDDKDLITIYTCNINELREVAVGFLED